MSVRTFARVLVAAALAASFAPATANALLFTIPITPIKMPPSASTGLPKPPQTAHPDAPPTAPGEGAGLAPVTGPLVPPAAVPAADGSGAASTHVLDASSAAGSEMAASSDYVTRAWDGSNKVGFGLFDDGDMIVVEDPTSITGHAGLFDERYYSNLNSFAVWSANVKPVNGVQREQCVKYRAYDRAYGLWVPKEANHGVQARNWAAKQVGKPFNLVGSKTDLRSFYCSKLDWAAWRYTSGLDLDADGGYWVWPIDLVNSQYTRVFGYWN